MNNTQIDIVNGILIKEIKRIEHNMGIHVKMRIMTILTIIGELNKLKNGKSN